MEETPGHHRGQSDQAVGWQIQVVDVWRDIHEPVQLQPGQLQTAPTHTESLYTNMHKHTHTVTLW